MRLRAGCLLLLAGALVPCAAANPALPSCASSPHRPNHVALLTTPLPKREIPYYYFSYAAPQDAVEAYDSPQVLSVLVSPDITQVTYEFKLFFYGEAEQANGRFYFSGFYKNESDRNVTQMSFRRLNTYEVILSGRYCLEAGEVPR
jgi:hypothetical protein